MITSVISTQWIGEKNLIVTNISGEPDKSEIEQWKQSLHDMLQQLDDNTLFKVFVNLHGFKAIDMEAHKYFRDIIPLTLANYGWRTGYVDLFESEAEQLVIQTQRGIQCVAVAHAHHDETKMELYESRFGRDREHFFTDPEVARNWIEQVALIH